MMMTMWNNLLLIYFWLAMFWRMCGVLAFTVGNDRPLTCVSLSSIYARVVARPGWEVVQRIKWLLLLQSVPINNYSEYPNFDMMSCVYDKDHMSFSGLYF